MKKSLIFCVGPLFWRKKNRSDRACRVVHSSQCCMFHASLCTIQSKQVFISKNQPGLRRSNPLKSSPGSHSLLVSDSVSITSGCLFLAFPLSVSLVSMLPLLLYPSRTCNCARLLRSHDNNACDVIIAHAIHRYKQTRKTQSDFRTSWPRYMCATNW